MNQLSFLLEEPLANPSASQDSEKDWMIRVATSCSALDLWLRGFGHVGLSGKMFPVSCRVTEDGILEPSSGRWASSGMGSLTGFLTLNTSEWNHTLGPSLKDEGVCSLSDILETGDLPQRFFLSAKACAGILRRAEKRGKELPGQLRAALESVATLTPQTETEAV